MNDSFKQHGAFSWCELMNTDTAAAKRFYGHLFGWSLEDKDMGEMTYTIVSAGGQQIGGMMKAPPQCRDMPPCWGTYVTVNDVDAVAKKAADLGGKVLVLPQDIPMVGRFTVIQDPQGAVISAITYFPM
jgi:predicted enzyme related to lactoylglutathione lyase